ncbi:tRNA adenosine(34) deaminase TadA [uncultured Micrococcus sp.]|uniref:tRNA adenosine(34) deaminase TadA n=1 Tax=uncultured Micrococcus sp. TaxID=114051 RepID=UPI0021CB239C|nr:tRNA adenosine(34) deaminase TadA [uncultured Micrococcus sp.]
MQTPRAAPEPTGVPEPPSPSASRAQRGTPSPDEHTWMGLALDAARRAEASQDVPIGAVVVDGQGEVIASACNEREATDDPTAHAEVLALRAAVRARRDDERSDGWRLADCTLVVTLEPCPMCAGAMLLARVPRVVFGAWDAKAGACGSVLDVVREPRFNHTVEVRGGVREAECAALLREFFARRRG